MTSINPDVEAYGPDARHSALADILELQALHSSSSMTLGDLQDYLDDAGWVETLANLSYDTGKASKGKIDSNAQEQAQRIFDLLAQRAQILDARYPFELKGNRLVASVGAIDTTYVQLLTLTIDHAYRPRPAKGEQKPTPNPETVFENVVHEYARSLGFESHLCAYSKGQFRNLALDVSSKLGLPALLDNTQWRKAANEEGVDCIARIPIGRDQRSGQWCLLGQATVGQTQTWRRKANEPKTGLWSNVFGGVAQCIPFLAIPHHAPDEKLVEVWDLRQNEKVVVLDRLRLCARDIASLPDLQTIAARVMNLALVF